MAQEKQNDFDYRSQRGGTPPYLGRDVSGSGNTFRVFLWLSMVWAGWRALRPGSDLCRGWSDIFNMAEGKGSAG